MNNDIWNSFTSDPTTGVTVLTADGEVIYINEQSTRIFFDDGRAPSAVIGKSINEMGFPEQWVKERLELMRRIRDTGEGVLLRTVWSGKQQYSWMRPIEGEDGEDGDGRGHVLVITRRIAGSDETAVLLAGEHEVTKSGVISLGELSVLTPRELEVLALLGQQMSIKEIANTLFRSVKTIENHRESIGRKLKRTRGIELAGIAQSAGLVVEDSKRTRVDGANPEEN
ncbi:MAG: LuxR C-terminal-related transcriptional regulator [Phycisphaerales bacterium]